MPSASAHTSVRATGSQSATSCHQPVLPHRQRLEGRAVDALPRTAQRDAETGRPRRAVTVVAVEQLQHAGGLAERAHALLELRSVDRVDQPDASLDAQRVRGAGEPLVLHPAEAVLELVNRQPPHAAP